MLPRLLVLALLLSGFVNVAWCEQAQNDDQNANAADGADGANGADGADGASAADGADGADGAQMSDGSKYIKYWTEYAILPKRCIV
jgi:hypothetical protein